MDPAISGVATVIGRIGSSALSALLRKPLLRAITAWRVKKSAEECGIEASALSIFQWLKRKDVQDHLISGDLESIDTAINNLAWRLPGSSRQDAEVVIGLVMDQYLIAHSGGLANLIGTNRIRHDIRLANAETQAHVARIPEQILNVTAVFEQELESFHPWHVEEARAIEGLWSGIRELTHTLVGAAERATLLGEWGKTPPAQLSNAPSEAWIWLGLLAVEYGSPEAAIAFFEEGVSKGQPRSYWLARATLLLDPDRDAERIDALLSRAGGQHALARAMAAYQSKDYEAIARALGPWVPDKESDRALRAFLLSVAAAGKEEWGEALAVLEPFLSPDKYATQATIRAAELLLDRSQRSGTLNRIDDLARAKRLAIQARDQLRQWKADTISSVLAAARASVLAHDLAGAINVMSAPPNGEATEKESQDPRTLAERALISALSGDETTARELLDQVPDGFEKEYCLGILGSNAGELTAAEDHFLRAWEGAQGDVQRLRAAHALAALGRSIPDLSKLQADHPEAISEIRELHQIMASEADRLSLLRASAHKSPHLMIILVNHLEKLGEHRAAAEVLERDGNSRRHPLLMSMAAQKFVQVGEFRRALSACDAALSLAGSEWVGQLDVLGIMFEAQEALLMHTEALNTARRMLSLKPESLDARWAVVQCLVREGSIQDAWNALILGSEPVDPRSPHEARIWIKLLANFDESDRFVSRSLNLLAQWEGDEEVQALVLQEISLHPNREPASDADLMATQAALQKFCDTYPDSVYFRKVSIANEDDPLLELTEVMRKNAPSDALIRLNNELLAGRLPLGFGAEMARRGFTECIILRITGHVFSDVQGTPTRDISQSWAQPVVLDPTAAVTLARLDEQLARRLIGAFAFLDITTTTYHDALAAQAALGMLSTLTAYWDPEQERMVTTPITLETALDRQRIAEKTVSIIGGARKHYRPLVEHLPELQGTASTWLSSLDLAIHTGESFWSDDALTRTLAEAKGVVSFSTAELIRTLFANGLFSDDEFTLAIAALVTNFHVDLGASPAAMGMAATLDGWQAKGTASSLARPATWFERPEIFNLVGQAVENLAAERPDQIRLWIAASSEGLILLAGDDSNGASHNLRLLLTRIVSRGPAAQAVFPFIMAGARDALARHPSVTDPIEALLRDLHSHVTQELDPEAAANFLMGLVAGSEPQDQATAARVILTADWPTLQVP